VPATRFVWGLPAWTEPERHRQLPDAGFSDVTLDHDATATFARARKA
jgi:hypothetical protein